MARSRATIYLDSRIFKTAKVKAALTGKTLSSLVSDALVAALREDDADLAAFERRRKEPSRAFEDVLRDLKADGLL